jgi:hypothetical protein
MPIQFLNHIRGIMPEQIDYSQRYAIRAGRVIFANYAQRKQLINEGRLTGLELYNPNQDGSIIRVLQEGEVNTTPAELANYLAEININPTSNSSGPTYTTFYDIFTTEGSTTWTAPTTCQSPITYWIVGGGGGGSGAYDQRGNGGGGGGAAITGTYAVVAGTTYDIVVGAGGDGGTGQGTQSGGPGTGTHTDGADGTDSSFDVSNGGPVAAGGGKGLIADPYRTGGTGGTVTTGGGGGGGGGNGGGGGGAGGNGTNGANAGVYGPGGTGGSGVSFTIPGYNGGNAQVYGAGGNGGANRVSGFVVGVSGSANTGKGEYFDPEKSDPSPVQPGPSGLQVLKNFVDKQADLLKWTMIGLGVTAVAVGILYGRIFF